MDESNIYMSSTEISKNLSLPNVGVLVMSCDAYSDLWQPFFTLFERYWSDCPLPIYLSSNFKVFEHSKVKNISTQRATNWSDEMRETLRQFPHDYIIYFQEDYFLRKKVDNTLIFSILNTVINMNAAYCRLFPFPPPDLSSPTEGVGIIAPHAIYRTSLQAAIWEKTSLLNLLSDNESPWDFEVNASQRSSTMVEPFLSVTNPKGGNIRTGDFPLTYVASMVWQGRFLRRGVRFARREGLSLNFNARPTQTFMNEVQLIINEFFAENITPSVKRVKSALKMRWHKWLKYNPLARFDYARYWENVYAKGVDGGNSGRGSYGILAAFKAEIVNAYVDKYSIQTVAEFGCGDGNNLKYMHYPNYIGLDVSATTIKKCQQLFSNDSTKRFEVYHPLHQSPEDLKAELVVCLDVLYHIITEKDFVKTLDDIFKTAQKLVILYTSVKEFDYKTDIHVKHRHIYPYLEKYTDFEIVQFIGQRYPELSSADFIILKQKDSNI